MSPSPGAAAPGPPHRPERPRPQTPDGLKRLRTGPPSHAGPAEKTAHDPPSHAGPAGRCRPAVP
ncbi:hypothetical protein DMH25_46535, partial [Streptomyces sp. WAC 01325]